MKQIEWKRILSALLVLVLVLSNVPATVLATDGTVALCPHHEVHTDCGYVEGESKCAFQCEACVGQEEPAEELAEELRCCCIEHCTAESTNEYCDVCAVDYNGCAGEDVATVYATSGTCGNNLTWVLTGDGTLTISGEGTMDDYSSQGAPWYSYEESIYEVVIKDGVTSIGSYAFEHCRSLLSVEIPDSIIRIGNYAFHCCTNLMAITVPDSVTSIGEGTFKMCESMHCVKIGSGVTRIGESAFSCCFNLTEIKFMGNAPSIYLSAFDYVSATAYYPYGNTTWNAWIRKNPYSTITWVAHGVPDNALVYGTCGDSLTWVLDEDGTLTISGTGAMDNYSNNSAPWHSYADKNQIQEIVIEDGVTSIGDYAFSWIRTDLDSELRIPDSVTSIGSSIFLNSYLGKVSIGSGVISIENDAFVFAEIRSIEVDADNTTYCSDGGVLFNKAKTSLIKASKGYHNYVVPDTVFSIERFAFYRSALTSVEIAANVAYIGTQAFAESGLTEIKFLGDAPNDGGDMFSSVTATAYYPANNPTWTADRMYMYNGNITWVPYGTEHIHEFDADNKCECGLIGGACGDNLTWVLDNKGTLTISGTGEMDDYGMGTAPWYSNRESVHKAVIEEGVTNIGEFALYDCASLTSVMISDSVTSIGDLAFYYCISLTSVSIPDSVTRVGLNPFTGCSGLAEIKVDEANANYSSDSYGVLFDKEKTRLLICPGGKTGTYVIPDSVTSIGLRAFMGCQNLTGVTIPNSVTSIGEYAFTFCTSLTSVAIPESVTIIQSDAFHGCDSLTNVSIPDSATKVGAQAFYGCDNLTSVTIGNSLTNISWAMFADCLSLTSVTIPDSITDINELAFSGCTNLSVITFKGSAPNIRSSSFDGVIVTAYYPGDNATWTDEKLQNYGGEITWIPYCVGDHVYEDGLCKNCGEKQPGPTITKQPESVESPLGQKFKIAVEAEGEGLAYQWYYKDASMKEFKISSNKTSSYAYTMQTYMHNRQVYCVVTDANGNSVQTETATITRPPQALKIIEQPQDARVNVGEKFSISPKVEGEGLTYQWYVKESGAKAFKVSSNKTSTYAYTMQNYMIGRQVYCVITDKYGNEVTTDVATISLPPVELKILEQPTDAEAALGEKFSIAPEVQGDGLTYQWYYKDVGMKEFRISSNKTSSYAYTMQSYMDGRSVYCVITDQYGNQVTTEVATIYLTK